MASYSDLLKVAKSLGLQGPEAEEYISKQLTRIHAEKLETTEAEKEKALAEERRLIAEKDLSESARIAAEASKLASDSAKAASEAAKAAAEAETQRLLTAKAVAELEKELQKKQLEADREEKKRTFDLSTHEMAKETRRQQDRFKHEAEQKQLEFENALKKADIEKETKLGVKQIEITQSPPQLVVPHGQGDKRYDPRLPVFHQGENLVVFLDRFVDSMCASGIERSQWIVRLRDILTGKVLMTFQDLSETDKQSFDTVRDRLLASQNLTAEHYRKEFNVAEPDTDQGFSDYVSMVKTTLDRWLQLSHVSENRSLYELIIRSKILTSCNPTLAAFLIERDPRTLEEMIRIGDQYCSAHPNIRIRRDMTTPLQAYACETQSVMSDEEMDAAAAQTWPCGRTPQQAKPWQRGQLQGLSHSEQRQGPAQPPMMPNNQSDKRFRDHSASRGGCIKCGSITHQTLQCPIKRDDHDRGAGGQSRNTGCWFCLGPHLLRRCKLYQQAYACQTVPDHVQEEQWQKQNPITSCSKCDTCRHQDTHVPSSIHPAMLAIPESTPLKLGKGFIGQQVETTMFDTGANLFGVDRKYVPKSAYTGKYIRCRTFSGRLEIYPECQLYIRTPFYSGYARLASLRKPMCGLIFGQLSGVRKCSNREINEWYKRNGLHDATVITRCGGKQKTHSTKSDVQIANAIMTRGETRKQRKRLQQERADMNMMPTLPQSQTPTNCQQTERLTTITEEEDISENIVPQLDNHDILTNNHPDMTSHNEQPVAERNIDRENTVEKSMDLNIVAENVETSFAQDQKDDNTLNNCFKHATTSNYHHTKNGKWQFYVKDNILYRYFASRIRSVKQFMVPMKHRNQVLVTGHDSIFAGHMGFAKTLARIRTQFHWPGIVKDVKQYVRSCHICQKMTERGTVPPAEVKKVFLQESPFQKVSIDLVGEIHPVSDEGHRFIMTYIDTCSRWADAVALKHITAQDIANARMGIFCRMGFPDVILTDNGTQFVSRTMRDFTDMLWIAQTFCSRFHPSSNGIVEKLHRCLKQMIAKVTAEFPRSWHTALPAILFAYNACPHTSTQLSSHEILFGSSLRGPLFLLRDTWVQPENKQMQTYNSYLNELRKRIIRGCQLARENLTTAGETQREYANRGRKLKTLKPDCWGLV